MTDNEIIKALKTEIHQAEYIDSSYCDIVEVSLIKETLDLINRQKAEIRVKNKLLDIAEEKFKTIKAEAIKEFAERLKEKSILRVGCVPWYDIQEAIDNLVKEMTEQRKEDEEK